MCSASDLILSASAKKNRRLPFLAFLSASANKSPSVKYWSMSGDGGCFTSPIVGVGQCDRIGRRQKIRIKNTSASVTPA